MPVKIVLMVADNFEIHLVLFHNDIMTSNPRSRGVEPERQNDAGLQNTAIMYYGRRPPLPLRP